MMSKSEPARLGLAAIVQVAPSHCSMSVLLFAIPTATQLVLLGHDTPLSAAALAFGLGLGESDHVEPFQRSMMGPSMWFTYAMPTAVHALPAPHETPDRWLYVLPAGLSLVTVDQVIPFQRRTNVETLLQHWLFWPTAKQLVVDAHDTPNSAPLLFVPLALMLHEVPSHSSMTVAATFDPPTAKQRVAVGQDTPVRPL
jgi:hypothetical protein